MNETVRTGSVPAPRELHAEPEQRPSVHAGEVASDLDETAELPEITFVQPIPGFTGLRRFVLVSLADDRPGVMYELRSLEDPAVRFMVAAPSAFFSDYDIELDDQDCLDLGLTTAADALVLVMLTVGPDAASSTANLLAPVIINGRTRLAAQVILTGSDWPVRVPLG